MAAYAAHSTKLLKNTQKTRATQKSLPLRKWRFTLGKKWSGEWAKSRKRSDKKSERTRQKNKSGNIEKRDQTDSPEIPDRGETSEIPGLPSGDK